MAQYQALSQMFQLALQHHQAGQLPQAQVLYQQILQRDPHHSDAIHLLGVIAYQEQDYHQAVKLIQQAIRLNDHMAPYYNNLGSALKVLGRLPEAIESFQKVLALQPHHVGAHINLGNVLREQKDFEQARVAYQKALSLEPHSVEAYWNLGMMCKEQGQLEEALAYYNIALSFNPKHVGVYDHLGQALEEQNQFAQAAECYQHMLSLDPHDVRAYNNLGRLFQRQKNYPEALQYYQQAVKLNPNIPEVYYNLGNLCYETGNFAQAELCYQQTLTLRPDFAQAHYALGCALGKQDQWSQAMLCYQNAIALNPRYLEAHNNLGEALKNSGHIEQAIAQYQQVLEYYPSHMTARSNLLLTLNYFYEERAVMFQAHQQFNEFCQTLLRKSSFLNERTPHRTLKIGYVSQDFRSHSVAYFIEPILAHHDHQQFEIFCYYNAPYEDEVTHRLQRYADHWINCDTLSDEVLREHIQEASIDILVDLMGHTGNNRMALFAQKVAPLQVSYLGYSNTTGLTTIDYRITDRYTDLDEALSSETLIRMPQSYFCYQPADETRQLPISPPPVLENHYITFGSFNHLAKLSPHLLALWTQILDAVPTSKLLIKSKSLADPSVQELLQKRLGVAPDRLILAHYTPSLLEHLNKYSLVDIGLDSYPYNGATTTCESLWMGVPVVTLVGETHVSRMGLSILSAVGLTDWITYHPQEYVDRCVQLAHRIDDLRALRTSLREKMLNSSLMDAKSFTHYLENQYRIMWENWCHQE